MGYLLPDDKRYDEFENNPRSLATTVLIEISIKDLVCESATVKQLGGQISACVLEDILAEKLRALLQQRLRNRNRPQDVYDISFIVQNYFGSLDLDKVSQYLKQKAAIREVKVSRGAFDDTIRSLACEGYGCIFSEEDARYVPFERAWVDVLSLVSRLDLPD